MKWYDYLMCFLGGAFVANFFPHFVNGVSGREFRTPFNALFGAASGLSPAPANVAWALANLAAGLILLRYGRLLEGGWAAAIAAFAGFALSALMLSINFAARG